MISVWNCNSAIGGYQILPEKTKPRYLIHSQIHRTGGSAKTDTAFLSNDY